jgi:hypothetical protein
VLAEGAPRVLASEEPAPLQLWHQLDGQFLEAVRQHSGQQVKAISGVCLKPLFEEIGELCGRADKALGIGLGARAWWDGRIPRGGLRTSERFGLGENRQDALEESQFTPGCCRLRLVLCVCALGILDCVVVQDEHVSERGRQRRARIVQIYLHDHWVPLRWTVGNLRPANLKVRPEMVDVVQFLGIKVQAALAVGDDCVVLPAIPELAAYLDELLGNRAPLVCVERVFVAEIVGFSVGRSTRRVPGRAPSADKIQRGEYPGYIERFAKVVGTLTARPTYVVSGAKRESTESASRCPVSAVSGRARSSCRNTKSSKPRSAV